ncbi:alpha/beta-hydrolase [Podospora aff. communis PSN243]|uniref:Alpha/beta-hydrolase n=1 Tax=Podospora aff. communis PSN243 TaxID=3040156 RepID=A0AAV9GIK4_9PEZI|nr:alpha/beta-hydrolase [Podospora aff. communis PSN243]
MITGLQQTVAYLHELIRAEARELDAGERGVVLGGLSQGCAASLVAGLLWDGERLRGLVGMCGWLPFMREMERVVVDEEEGGEDVFERNENGQEEKRVSEVGAVAMSVLREMLDLEAEGRSSRPAVLSTPVFLGHGSVDEKVSIQLGKASAETLMSLGVDVEWHTYEGLGHWFSDEMIADMAHFLDEKASMEK